MVFWFWSSLFSFFSVDPVVTDDTSCLYEGIAFFVPHEVCIEIRIPGERFVQDILVALDLIDIVSCVHTGEGSLNDPIFLTDTKTRIPLS